MKEYKIKQLIQVEYTWTIKAKSKGDAQRILKQGVYDNREILEMPIYREIESGKETKKSEELLRNIKVSWRNPYPHYAPNKLWLENEQAYKQVVALIKVGQVRRPK